MKKFAIGSLLLALLLSVAALCGASGFAASADSSVSSSTEVFRRLSGVQQGFSYEEPLTTDGLALSVSIDMPSGQLGYVGINSAPGGIGQPVSAQHGIGILLYNSNDRCLAIEVYSHFAWMQYTATTEMTDILPNQTITLSLRRSDGEWGLYVNGTLFTAVARSDFDGVTAGSVFNPVAYIDEAEFTSGGLSYIEVGTWTGGGSITLYQQTLRGHFDVVDRDGEEIAGLRISGAYNADGTPVSVLSSTVENGDYVVSTLSGDGIEALMVETPGGAARTVVPGTRTVIRSRDARIRVTDGSAPLGGVSVAIDRDGEGITQYINVRFENGEYILEDVAADVQVTLTRNGFEEAVLAVSASADVVEQALTPAPFTVSVAVKDVYTGRTVSAAAANLSVLDGSSPAFGVQITPSAEGFVLEGLSGNVDDLTLSLSGLAGYADAQISLAQSYGGSVTLYTAAVYDGEITLRDAQGSLLAGASVTAGGQAFTEGEGGVYTLAGLRGDTVVSVEAGGYVPQQILLTSASPAQTVTLSEEAQSLALTGAEEGARIRYTVNGLGMYEATVQNGSLTLSASAGDTVRLISDEYYFPTDEWTLPHAEPVTAVPLLEVTVTFVYGGAPAADVAVTFDRTAAVTDGNGQVTLVLRGSGTLALESAQGYRGLSETELAVSPSQTSFTVTLTEREYTARVTLRSEAGDLIRNRRVQIGGVWAEKTADGVYFVSGLTGENAVLVEGASVTGTVTETSPELTLVLAETGGQTPAPEPPAESSGCASSAAAALPALALPAIAAAALLARKKRAK